MMLQLFDKDEIEITVDDSYIESLQGLTLFENSRLDTYNKIICDSRDLETIILREGMQFFGRTYLYKISKSLKMIDDSYDKTFTYISVYGVFDAYTQGKNYKRFYDI